MSSTQNAARHRPILVVAAAAALLAACGGTSQTAAPGSPQTSPSPSPGGFPVTVTTSAGPVKIAARPTSIISLSSTATEMLYAIGAGAQVKAVDEYSTYPTTAPRTKLSGLQPNVEAMIAKKPDLVVASGDAADFRKRLTGLGVPVLLLPAAAKIDDVYAELATLGTATGRTAEAKQEQDHIRTELQRIVASVPKASTVRTYYYELDPTYYSVTSTTFVGQVLQLVGLRSIADRAKGAAAAGGYPQLSSEYIVNADPDYVFLADTKCCHQDAKTLGARPGWSAISAVKQGHVVNLDDDIASRWGPRIVDLLRKVADATSGRS